MCSWTVLIHECGSKRSVLGPLFHFLFNLHIRTDWKLIQSLHIYTQRFILSDFQTIHSSFIRVDKQVLHLLVIYFKHWNGDFVFTLAFFLKSPDSLEKLFTSHGYDSLVDSVPDHRVRLASTSLSICKQTTVESYPELNSNYHAFYNISSPKSS
jgi:hypothetical protein